MTSACCSSVSPSSCLDGLHLLAQEVLALGLVDLFAHVALDLGAQLEHLELLREDARELAQALLDVALLEQLLLVLGLDAHGAGDQERERAGIFDVGRRHLQLFGQIRHQVDDLREDGEQVGAQRVDLLALDLDVVELLDVGHEVRLLRDEGGRRARAAAPCTRIRMVPSGSLTILCASPTVPTR